jgi:hypothetical protein
VNETWRRTLAVGLAFVVAITGTFVFAYRAGRQVRHIRAVNEPIRAWMSVPFIAHAHHLHRPVPDLISQLQRAIDAAAQPPGGHPR